MTISPNLLNTKLQNRNYYHVFPNFKNLIPNTNSHLTPIIKGVEKRYSWELRGQIYIFPHTEFREWNCCESGKAKDIYNKKTVMQLGGLISPCITPSRWQKRTKDRRAMILRIWWIEKITSVNWYCAWAPYKIWECSLNPSNFRE